MQRNKRNLKILCINQFKIKLIKIKRIKDIKLGLLVMSVIIRFKLFILDLIVPLAIILLFVKSASKTIQNTLINLKKFVYLKITSPHQMLMIWLLLAICCAVVAEIVLLTWQSVFIFVGHVHQILKNLVKEFIGVKTVKIKNQNTLINLRNSKVFLV